jgi:Protein of unknown function (DUF3833)
VLDLREVFAAPWEGEGVLWRPWWLRALPVPSAFTFRSEIRDLRGDEWDVLDTTTFPDGTVQRRVMSCRRLAPDRLVLSAPDMPGGAEVRPRADGFDFTPYVIRTPVLGPLRVPLRHHDRVELQPDGTMLDVIELRFLGLRVGVVTMRMRRLG